MSITLHYALSKLKELFYPKRNRSEENTESKIQYSERKNLAENVCKSSDVHQFTDSDQSFQDSMQLLGVKPTQLNNARLVEKNTAVSQVDDSFPEKKNLDNNLSAPQDIKPVNRSATLPSQQNTTRQSLGQQTAPPARFKLKKSPANVIKNAPKPSQTPYSVQVTSEILPNSQLTRGVRWAAYQIPDNLGDEDQIVSKTHEDEREVVIGLDFGTAYTKVVIGDSALGKAFAVPFFDHVGLPAYLLPSRVWLNGDQYTLLERGDVKQRLKLNLIEKNDVADCFCDATAFLALVIRHARGWLFINHSDLYKNTRVLWKLTIGLPAATYDNEAIVLKFRNVAECAWWIAGQRKAAISRDLVAQICGEKKKGKRYQAAGVADSGSVVFDVIPELSAQIYGFLMSSKFDPKARNCFLMVDIGAGTVDSSIFKVSRDNRRRWEFRFFSNVVQFNGVANLNDVRIKFLTTAFKNLDIFDQHVSDFSAAEASINNIDGIPNSLDDYFSGIKFSFSDWKFNPDHYFYNEKFKKQITNDTLKGAQGFFSDKHVFKGMPLFLCGGGSRMDFFKKLEKDLASHKNASWFNFVPQNLEVPPMLSAKGVRKSDFDRLSVAFGLSFLDVGNYVREHLKGKAVELKTENSRRCNGCGATGTCYCD